MRISDFIDKSNKVSSTAGLFEILLVAASESGFDHVAYGVLSGDVPSIPRGLRAPAVMLNYPSDWVEYYFKRGYEKIDPVVRYSPLMPAAYPWDELALRHVLSADELLVMNEAREAGLRSGVGVPLHGPRGSVAVISFASRNSGNDAAVHLGRLQAIGAQFHVAYTELVQESHADSPQQLLSERERDCLQWAAAGKSSWDIGMILGISEFTVCYHIKKVMRKLDTSSRIVAVIKAIRLGLISV